jgi:hypothetical protein
MIQQETNQHDIKLTKNGLIKVLRIATFGILGSKNNFDIFARNLLTWQRILSCVCRLCFFLCPTQSVERAKDTEQKKMTQDSEAIQYA